MSDRPHPDGHDEADAVEADPGANTEMFQAFVKGAETDAYGAAARGGAGRGKAVGAPFRLLTLVIGLAVFGGLVWLLLRW